MAVFVHKLIAMYVDFCLRTVLVHLCFSQEASSSVKFLNPPEVPESVYPMEVQYSCSGPLMVHVQVLVSFDTGSTVTIFHRWWPCLPGPEKIRPVLLHFPDWLVYHPDWIIDQSSWVLSCLLRSWVGSSASVEPGRSPSASAVVAMNVQNPLSRPFKQHLLCPSWNTEIRWKVFGDRWQCLKEDETPSLLSSLYGSTGEHFGITKSLHPFRNEMLEGQRIRAVSYPWCAFTVWVLLEQPCRDRLCGLFHHIDSKENYATPTVFLTRTGQLHVQLQGEGGLSSAFLSPFTLPVGLWCLLTLELKGRMGKITVSCTDGDKDPLVYSFEHMFNIAVMLDDTDGYFVIGGGKYVRGIEGFYGPVIYHRTRIPSTNLVLQLPWPVRMVNLSGWFEACQEFKLEVDHKIADASRAVMVKRESCTDVYTALLLKTNTTSSKAECSSFQPLSKPQRRMVAQLVRMLSEKNGMVDPESVGRALYSAVLRKLNAHGSVEVMNRLMPSLLQAGCLGDNRALHLSSVLYSSGLGVKKQPYKAWLLSLLAARKDYRLALLRLGHLHHVGDQTVPPDPDLSYAYYSNIAKQTSTDRLNPSSQQTFVESVLLNDEETLNAQTNTNDDLFHWLKLQARNGVADAEQAIARMLFWGQQGVTSDIQTAVRHYERGATRLQDPVSMYDYAIVLLTGQGVPKDVPRAITFLKKAIEQGFTPAITALGWYYEQYERNYKRAAELWEQADHLGNPDAAMNLGVLHSQGLYPGQAADKVKAYKYFLKSAQRGHINGGIELAEIWSRGISGYVPRRPSDAVLWVKWASEQNGYLGTVLRKGLNAYLQGNWFMAMIYYLMSSECGFKAAQFNVAFLCEHSPSGSLNSSFVTQCMLQYYNLSIQSQDPDSYALVKMGDLLYEKHTEGQGDLSAAAEMYKEAALKNNPQGWYSLGLLVQEGQRLPATVLSQLNLLQHYFSDKHTLLTTLYQRCRDSSSDEAHLPCTLALLATHLQSLQSFGNSSIKLLSVVAVAVATLSFFKIIPVILRQRSASVQQNSVPSEAEQPTEQEESSGV
ncbi:protein sel-1 homolog 3 [Astyanax mexicanus]|uniref:protein sel-1 homolog 3 n=1 Tax=Astyanax mexicanus TaxID=7994 RepID=UPI0020CB283D|nr:protein sel-1 homolog 3 [Astyanax mexicanus]